MTNEKPVSSKQHVSALVLANIGEVTAVLMKTISGNEISNALNGETLTKEMMTQLSMTAATAEIVQNGVPAI